MPIPEYDLVRSDHPCNNKRGGVPIYYKSFLPLKLIDIIDKWWQIYKLPTITKLSRQYLYKVIKLKSVVSKLHNTSASIVFITEKALFVDVIPKIRNSI